MTDKIIIKKYELEVMASCPHLLVTGEQGCGKTTLLNLMSEHLNTGMRNGSVYKLADLSQVQANFHYRTSQYKETEQEVADAVGGKSIADMNNAQHAYYQKRMAEARQAMREIWLVVDNFEPSQVNLPLVRELLHNHCNIHLLLAFQSTYNCGLRMVDVTQAVWYHAAQRHKFEYRDLAEWPR